MTNIFLGDTIGLTKIGREYAMQIDDIEFKRNLVNCKGKHFREVINKIILD